MAGVVASAPASPPAEFLTIDEAFLYLRRSAPVPMIAFTRKSWRTKHGVPERWVGGGLMFARAELDRWALRFVAGKTGGER
jgi:hypothetical protein